MAFNTFERSNTIQGDKFNPRDNKNTPLIVIVHRRVEGIKTKHNQNPAKESQFKPDGQSVVYVDVVDLKTGGIFIDVMWMAGAVVDQLAPIDEPTKYVGAPTPIKLVECSNKSEFNHLEPRALEGDELQVAVDWWNAYGSVVAQRRTEFEAKKPTAPVTAAPVAAPPAPALPSLGVPAAPPAAPAPAAAAPAPVAAPAPAPAAAALAPAAAAPAPAPAAPVAAAPVAAAPAPVAPAPVAAVGPAPAAPAPAPAPAAPAAAPAPAAAVGDDTVAAAMARLNAPLQ
jgi:hypothetical protein